VTASANMAAGMSQRVKRVKVGDEVTSKLISTRELQVKAASRADAVVRSWLELYTESHGDAVAQFQEEAARGPATKGVLLGSRTLKALLSEAKVLGATSSAYNTKVLRRFLLTVPYYTYYTSDYTDYSYYTCHTYYIYYTHRPGCSV
jgi:hypothetical protein